MTVCLATSTANETPPFGVAPVQKQGGPFICGGRH